MLNAISCSRTWVVLVSSFVACLCLAQAGRADENQGNAFSDKLQKYYEHRSPNAVLAEIREANEGAFFLLSRYAVLEALITAKDQGQSDNEAFWTGAASSIPGAGQMINHDYLQGTLLLFPAMIAWSTAQQLSFTDTRKVNAEWLPWYHASMAFRNGIMTYSMLHAANASYRQRRDRTAAMWTGTASLLPGVGQAVNGQWWEAGGFFLSWALAAGVAAYCEEQAFPGNEDKMLVGAPSPWSVACLPGGAAVSYSWTW